MARKQVYGWKRQCQDTWEPETCLCYFQNRILYILRHTLRNVFRGTSRYRPLSSLLDWYMVILAGFCVATFCVAGRKFAMRKHEQFSIWRVFAWRLFAPKTRYNDMAQISHHNIQFMAWIAYCCFVFFPWQFSWITQKPCILSDTLSVLLYYCKCVDDVKQLL